MCYNRAMKRASINKITGHWGWERILGKKWYQHGYIMLLLESDDFFWPMAQHNGYIREHRLVMAKHLGRNLHPWEIVHHKNHIRDDNRIENLQLVSDVGHKQISLLETRIKQLEARVTLLEAENVALKAEQMTI